MDEDVCLECQGAGCHLCDGTPLTEEEIEEQQNPF